MPQRAAEDDIRALSLVERFGAHSTAFQTLAPCFRWWFCDSSAAIAYVDTGGAWVAAGPPLCAAGRESDVAQAFVGAARAAQRRCVFFASPKTLLPPGQGRAIVVGEEPLYDPKLWQTHRRASASLRQQLSRAQRKHVNIRHVASSVLSDEHSALRLELESLMVRWSAAHAMPPMGFLVDLNPFDHIAKRSFWLAEMPDLQTKTLRIVGFAAVIAVPASGGIMLEHLVRCPDAPNGCAELLIDAVFSHAQDKAFISLGMVPLHNVSFWPLRAARWAGEGLYHFGGLARFKAKLMPVRWTQVFVVWPHEHGAISALFDVICAFLPQGLWRFFAGIVGRGSSVLLRSLAWVLVPWTMVLASVEGDVWFPSKALQHFWTGFDILLGAGLFALSHRWRRSLATLLAALVSFDALATAIEVYLYPKPVGLFADAVRALAIAAPSVTAVVLWNARAYRARYRLKGQPLRPGKR